MSHLHCSESKPPPPPTDDRVATAYYEKEEQVKEVLASRNLSLQEGLHLFIRAFKEEQRLEVWAKHPKRPIFERIVTYPFCTTSGKLGPKRKEGDRQIPEGFYHINVFNPKSLFYLSLGINYPNEADLIFADKEQPGSAIFIHGNCQTVGCIPITDDKIKELYIFATEAKKSGQTQIPVHIFPAKLTEQNLQKMTKDFPEHAVYWSNLKEGYDWFEETNVLPKIEVDMTGKYYFRSL